MPDKVICSNQPDLEMYVSVTSGPKSMPVLNVYAVKSDSRNLAFCLELNLEQGQTSLDKLEEALSIVESDLIEAGENSKH